MIFNTARIALFVVAAMTGIALLLALPGPYAPAADPTLRRTGPRGPDGPRGPEPDDKWAVLAEAARPTDGPVKINRHTGERIRTARELLDEARLLGDARLTSERLEQLAEAAPEERLFDEPRALLRAEMTLPAVPELDDDLRQRLQRATLDTAELVALLEELHDDAEIGKATEDFFALARWPDSIRAAANPPPDLLADRARRDLANGRTDLHQFIHVADQFEAFGRGRAQVRWLLRGFARYPGSQQLRDRLLSSYVARGRLAEAWALSTHALAFNPVDEPFWRNRAQLAAWLNMPVEEASALEHILASTTDDAARRRLLQLYVHIGQPERAVPHAERLAQLAGELAETEQAIQLALASGLPDRALELLEQLAQRSDDPTRWQEQIVEYALQDLRLDRAIAELEDLARRHPGPRYERRLEELYRRTDRPEPLADLLERQLDRTPDDPDLWMRLLNLRAGLGQEQRIRALLNKMASIDLPPLQFFERLPQLEQAGVPTLEERAMEIAKTGEMPATVVGEVLEQLRPYLAQPRFRDIANALVARFPDDPAARRFRLDLIDALPSAAERSAAAEELVRAYPSDDELRRAWIDRAAWAGLVTDEIRARETWCKLHPDDADNRARLAELYEFDGRAGEAVPHWQTLADAAGPRSDAAGRLIAALLASGQFDQAMALLEARVNHPDATVADRLAAGEQMFGLQRLDQAALFYRSVLAEQPDQAVCLLRMGQILSWSNDPGGAIPYLERRLAATDEQRELVEYYLGEALWSVREHGRARGYHESALEAMRALVPRTAPVESMIARMLFRLGRVDEAKPIYRWLLAAEPGNLNLALDFAEVLMHVDELDEARAWVDEAARIDPHDARVLRVDGQLLTREGKLAQAQAVLARSIERYGPDAGVLADLGQAHELDDKWPEALASYRQWLTLQPDSTQAAASVQRMADRLDAAGIASVLWRRTGDDRVTETGIGASLWTSDATKLNLLAGHGSYRGRAAAVGNGLVDLDSDLTSLDAALDHRLGRGVRVGGGLGLAVDSDGRTPVSAWAGLHLRGDSPYRVLELRGHANEVLTEPAAAVALAGRRHALELTAFSDLGRGWWGSLDTGIEALQVDADRAPPVSDGRFHGQISIGRAILEGEQAVGEPFRPRRCAAGPQSPYLLTSELHREQWLLQGWLTLQSSWLLDGDLAAQIPVARRFHYAVLGVRADRQLAGGLGASLEAHAGHSLSDSESIWGLDAGATWRPNRTFELTVRGAVGQQLGRTDSGDAFGAHAWLVLRW